MNTMVKLASYYCTYSANPKVQSAFEKKLDETSKKMKEAYTSEENSRKKCKLISEKEAFEIHLELTRNPIVFKK